MNNQQLQEAINKAREFVQVPSLEGGLLWKTREHTKETLAALEKLQVERAQLASKPITTFKGNT